MTVWKFFFRILRQSILKNHASGLLTNSLFKKKNNYFTFHLKNKAIHESRKYHSAPSKDVVLKGHLELSKTYA